MNKIINPDNKSQQPPKVLSKQPESVILPQATNQSQPTTSIKSYKSSRNVESGVSNTPSNYIRADR